MASRLVIVNLKTAAAREKNEKLTKSMRYASYVFTRLVSLFE